MAPPDTTTTANPSSSSTGGGSGKNKQDGGNDSSSKILTTTAAGAGSPSNPGIVSNTLALLRAACVGGVIVGATATGVSLSILVHTLSFNRKKAQGRSVYVCALVYSYALKLLPWIKIKTKIPDRPLDFRQFVLTSNHISFLDFFLISATMFKCMSRRSIENVRLIYWEALSKMPIIRWVFFLCGGIPIKILGSASLHEGDNKYCKESVKNVYTAVDRAVTEEGLSVALSFEGRRNPSPPTLSKIQRGMLKFSQNYDLPCLLIKLQGIEKIMPAEGLPSGTGVVETEILPYGYKWAGPDEYEAGLRAIYERGEERPANTVVLTEAEANALYEARVRERGALLGAAVATAE